MEVEGLEAEAVRVVGVRGELGVGWRLVLALGVFGLVVVFMVMGWLGV